MPPLIAEEVGVALLSFLPFSCVLNILHRPSLRFHSSSSARNLRPLSDKRPLMSSTQLILLESARAHRTDCFYVSRAYITRMTSRADSCPLIAGPAGSGKSVTLLQTVAYAHASGWVVLYMPSATPFVNSSTPHSYSSTQAIFEQPALATQLISKFLATNKAALKKIKSTKAYTFGEQNVSEGSTLDVLCSKASDRTSTAVLSALLDELAAQTSYVSWQLCFFRGLKLTVSSHDVQRSRVVGDR